MGASAVVKKSEISEFEKRGGRVQELPAQEKPADKALLYPFSGGKTRQIDSYPEQREFSPAVKLLKMSPKGITLGAGGGGKVELTQMDIAAALAAPNVSKNNTRKLSDAAYRFGLAKYLDDPAVMDFLLWKAWDVAVTMATEEKWRFPKGREVLRLASRFALAKCLKHAELYNCTFCGGAGQHRKGNCKPCNATGKRELSEREIARMLDTDHKNYKKTWRGRVDRIQAVFESWEQELLSHLYRQFARNPD